MKTKTKKFKEYEHIIFDGRTKKGRIVRVVAKIFYPLMITFMIACTARVIISII